MKLVPSEAAWILFISLIGQMHCGNILVWYTEGSHWINLKPVLEALVDRGHEVTVLTPSSSMFMDPTEKARFNYQLFNVSISKKNMSDILEEFLDFSIHEMYQKGYLEVYLKFYHLISKQLKMTLKICDGLMKSESVMEKLGSAGFQVLLVDPIYPCSELVAEKLGIPFIYSLRLSIAHLMERLCGQLPAPPSYVPGPMSKFTDKMSFTERLINLLFYWSQDIMAKLMWKEFDNYYSEISGRPTTYCEAMGKADIWLIRTFWDFDYPRPSLPNFKFVGGLHCKPAKPLPKDMGDFVHSSGDDGIIVFSLGSMIKNLTREKANMIASGLGQVPQKVIWGYSGEQPDALAPNTRVYKWIPQNDLLGHPKTKVFITHGGTNGLYEAIYHGVPILGIPMFADQSDNMVHMASKGAALTLNINNMQATDLVDSITSLTQDPSYKENALRLSRIHHDQPMTPLEQAVFWVEFVIRNKGAQHLRVQSHNLTWYQYLCLDVLAFLMSLVVLVSFFFFKACKLCFTKCCQRAKSKTE